MIIIMQTVNLACFQIIGFQGRKLKGAAFKKFFPNWSRNIHGSLHNGIVNEPV